MEGQLLPSLPCHKQQTITKMKYILLLASVCLCLSFNAQNTVTLGKSTDFKTIKDNKVIIEMTLENQMESTELNNLNQWVADNNQAISMVQDGQKITFSVSAELNDKNVYLKLWGRMGVSFVNVLENGQKVKLTTDQALSKFGL